ncbi:MAG: heme o synthase, partial [cyanobacterium endosymbiont of Rhopalodia yunnanensis]
VSGMVYGAIAVVLGVKFIEKAWQLKQDPFNQELARSLFKFSIFYLMLLCTGMVLDSLAVTHQLIATVGDNLKTLINLISFG